jgi:hypothetical protein
MEQHNLVLKRTGKKMIQKPYTIIILIFLFANSLATVYADEIKVTASVDKTTVEVGSDIRLTISVYGTLNKVRPKLPPFKDFSVIFGPHISMDTETTDDTVLVFHKYLYGLMARKTGNLEIKPVAVRYKKKTYKTDSINIEATGRTPF